MEFIAQIASVFLLVLLNGFFVASEFALVAVRKTRIDELVNKGSGPAKLVQKSINHLDTYISATQLGITLASLALGWAGEPTIAHFLEPLLSTFLPDPAAILSSHGLSIAIAFGIITFLHIVLGELVPKTIALQRAEKTVLLVIGPLSFFTTLFKPFIWILNGAGNLVLRIVGLQAPSGHQLVHSEEEIKMILAQSAKEGAIEKKEAEMVYSVLRLGDIPVENIMIPKSKIIAFEENTLLKEVISTAEKNLHSRFPVYRRSLDNIIGFIHIKDVYKIVLGNRKIFPLTQLYRAVLGRSENQTINQSNSVREILKIKDSRKIDDVLIDMKQARVHIAVVLNKRGHTTGIATLEDVLESLVGEIHDEFEKKSGKKKGILQRIIS
jgi:CBS domain containing-hemolysin-like protein